MTYEQTREQFLLAWNSNAYLNMCESDDMHNAIVALEKQIPRKPLNPCGRYFGKAKGGNCPCCGAQTNSSAYTYCRKCGQKLLWE